MKFHGEINCNHIPSREASGRELLGAGTQAAFEGEDKKFFLKIF